MPAEVAGDREAVVAIDGQAMEHITGGSPVLEKIHDDVVRRTAGAQKDGHSA